VSSPVLSSFHGHCSIASILVRIEALRPPLVNPKLKRVMGTEGEPVFELAPGVAQVFDQVCLSDESLLQQTSNGGSFPKVSRKKRRRLEDEAKAAAEVEAVRSLMFRCLVETQRVFRCFSLYI